MGAGLAWGLMRWAFCWLCGEAVGIISQSFSRAEGTTFHPTVLNAYFFVYVLYSGSIISHLDSLALIKIFLCIDNCSN